MHGMDFYVCVIESNVYDVITKNPYDNTMSGNPLMTADKRKYFQKVKHASLRFSQIHEQNKLETCLSAGSRGLV